MYLSDNGSSRAEPDMSPIRRGATFMSRTVSNAAAPWNIQSESCISVSKRDSRSDRKPMVALYDLQDPDSP
jgi:hypothetical protein